MLSKYWLREYENLICNFLIRLSRHFWAWGDLVNGRCTGTYFQIQWFCVSLGRSLMAIAILILQIIIYLFLFQSLQYHSKLHNFFWYFPHFSHVDAKAQRIRNSSEFPMLVNGRNGLGPLFRCRAKCAVFSTIFHYLQAVGMKTEI